MNDELSSATPSYRERVTLFLALLASDEGRHACHQVLAPDRFAFVWCRLWFDEIYVPSSRYLSGVKGDQSEETAAKFREAFAAEEMAALERFHRFLELRVDMLPGNLAEDESFPQNDAWDHVVRHAGYALEELETDPESLKQTVGSVAHVLARRSEETNDETNNPLLPSLREVLRQRRLTE